MGFNRRRISGDGRGGVMIDINIGSAYNIDALDVG
jgi:hypothetical protein